VRDELRRELRRLQREAGLSTVLVTHDPEEAAILADEIMVVADGQLLQAGPLREVYRHPASAEVARLLGIGNICPGVIAPDGTLLAGSVELTARTAIPAGTAVFWSVAPQQVKILRAPTTIAATAASFPATVTDVIDLGTTVEVTVQLKNGPELRSRSTDPAVSAEGEQCLVHLPPDAIIVWE